MSMDPHALVLACEQISALLRAAEVQVEQLTATHLGFRGAMRVHALAAQVRGDILLALPPVETPPVWTEVPTVRVAPPRALFLDDEPTSDASGRVRAVQREVFDEAFGGPMMPSGDLRFVEDEGSLGLSEDEGSLGLSEDEDEVGDDDATVSLSSVDYTPVTRDLKDATPARPWSLKDLASISEEGDTLSFSDDGEDPAKSLGGAGLVSFSEEEDHPLVSFPDEEELALVSFSEEEELALVSFSEEEDHPLVSFSEEEELALVSFSEEDQPLVQFGADGGPSESLHDDGAAVTFSDDETGGDSAPIFAAEELSEANAPLADVDPASGPFKMPDFFEQIDHPQASSLVDFGGADEVDEAAFADGEGEYDLGPEPETSEAPMDAAAALNRLARSMDTPPRAAARTTPLPENSDRKFTPRVAAAPVPTIRDADASFARPAAAAIQLNADQGTAKVLGFEDEVLELGDAHDFDEDYAEDDSSAGFRLELEEYEEDDSSEEEAPPAPKSAAPVLSGVQVLDAKQMASRMDRAEKAREAGQLDEAVQLFSDVLDADPDNLAAHLGRGRVYLDKSDYSRAMSDFTVAEDLAPGSAEPRVAMGDFFFARKEYRKAIDFFNEALEVSPDHAMAWCRRGISYYYRREYDAAVTDLTRAMKLNPDIPNISTYLSTAKRKNTKR